MNDELRKQLWEVLYPDFPEGKGLAKYEIRIDKVMQLIAAHETVIRIGGALDELSVIEKCSGGGNWRRVVFQRQEYHKAHLASLKSQNTKRQGEME